MLVFLALYIVLILRGPSIWDRLLGMSLVSAKVILFILIYASLNETSFLLDYAILYALAGFVGMFFIILFLSNKRRKERRK